MIAFEHDSSDSLGVEIRPCAKELVLLASVAGTSSGGAQARGDTLETKGPPSSFPWFCSYWRDTTQK